jgi:hypothetical protein
MFSLAGLKSSHSQGRERTMKKLINILALVSFASAFPASILAEPRTGAEQKLPIEITLFLHDQLTEAEIARLGSDYISWFTRDLARITRRQINIVEVRNKPGYTDFNYRLGDSKKSLYEWDQRIIDYVIHENMPHGKRHKYLLITRDDLTPSDSGIAYKGQRSAIASLTSYRTIAHEVGHLMSAEHSDGEFIFSNLCFTNMTLFSSLLTKDCYRYSDQTADVIRGYLDDTP